MAKATEKTAKKETQAEYRQRVMDVVCAALIEGHSLETICRSEIPDVPKRSGTIREWCIEDETLAMLYARARELQADALLETLPEKYRNIVAAYIKDGWEPKDAISAARNEIDAEKWRMQRMFPKKCGDKIEQTLQNPDGTKLDLTVNFVTPPHG